MGNLGQFSSGDGVYILLPVPGAPDSIGNIMLQKSGLKF